MIRITKIHFSTLQLTVAGMMLAVQPQWAMFVLKTCEIIQSPPASVTLIVLHLKYLNLSLQNILNLNTETLL